jgi:CheY-like chemotaxis protein
MTACALSHGGDGGLGRTEPAQTATEAAMPDDQTGRRLSALLVDDSDFDRRVLRRVARSLPCAFDFEEAANLGEMQRLLSCDHGYELIFLDYRLPDGTGLDGLDRIVNALPAPPPVIMLTGEDRAELAVDAMKRGCCDFLGKDRLTAATLARAVDGALSRRIGTADIWSEELNGMIKQAMSQMLSPNRLSPALADSLRAAFAELGAPPTGPGFDWLYEEDTPNGFDFKF